MTSMKKNCQSTASMVTRSKVSAEVEDILGVTLGGFVAVTRSKTSMLEKKTIQVSSATTPVFGYVTLKASTS